MINENEKNIENNDLDNAENNESGEQQMEQDAYKEQFLRLSADFQNYKRRVEKERIEWMLMARVEMLEDLLPIFDELDRAIELAEKSVSDDVKIWLDGLLLIQKKWQKIFSTLGIEAVVVTGEFDPELHEAVMQVETEEVVSHHIVQCFEKGYTLKGKVVRHAKVSVAK
ncbi:MAG: nucleotide exchange factor GrpE [bacterium]